MYFWVHKSSSFEFPAERNTAHVKFYSFFGNNSSQTTRTKGSYICQAGCNIPLQNYTRRATSECREEIHLGWFALVITEGQRHVAGVIYCCQFLKFKQSLLVHRGVNSPWLTKVKPPHHGGNNRQSRGFSRWPPTNHPFLKVHRKVNCTFCWLHAGLGSLCWLRGKRSRCYARRPRG